MNGERGFALASALVLFLAVFMLGASALYISQSGYTVISAEQRFQVAEKRANSGLMEAMNRIINGTPCQNLNGQLLGGALIRTVYSGGNCFIWSEGTYRTARVVKVGFLSSSGSNVGALNFERFTGDGGNFELTNRSCITGAPLDPSHMCPTSTRNNICAGVTFEDCGLACSTIYSYEGCSPGPRGCVEDVTEVSNLDITRLLRSSVEEIQQDLRDRFNTAFATARGSVPSIPSVTDPACIISNANDCTIDPNDPSAIRCSTGNATVTVSSNTCQNILISGGSVSLDLQNGTINANIIIDSASVTELQINEARVNGSIFIETNTLSCAGNECSVVELTNNSVITGDLVILGDFLDSAADNDLQEENEIKLANNSRIEGGVFIVDRVPTNDSDVDLKLANNATIQGPVVFEGYELEIEMANSSTIGGQVFANATHEIEFELNNQASINGTVFAYAGDELEIETSNAARLGGTGNLLLTDREFEIEMSNNSALDIGTVAWVGNDLAESEAEIELSNNTSFRGFILFGNLEELEMPNHTSIEGVLLGYNLGDEDGDGIELSNMAQIRGLTIVLNQLGGIELSNNSAIEGAMFVREIGLVDLSNMARVEFNADLVNQLIADFNLSDYFENVTCEPTGAELVRSFIARVY